MPILITKIEGKGNGMKTVLPNMAAVAAALNCPPAYPIKYFGYELGAQTSFNDETERYILNGSHEAIRLRDLLDGFIEKFILCPSCSNPETRLVITKDKVILRDCIACGESEAVDMRLKLVEFILKNPPDSTKMKGKSKGAAGADSLQKRTETLNDEGTSQVHTGAENLLSA